MSDEGMPVVVIGQRSKDGSVRLEGRDWHLDYYQVAGDVSPQEMGLKVEWLVAKHTRQKMERAAEAYMEDRKRSRQEKHDSMMDEMLDAVAQEDAGVPW